MLLLQVANLFSLSGDLDFASCLVAARRDSKHAFLEYRRVHLLLRHKVVS